MSIDSVAKNKAGAYLAPLTKSELVTLENGHTIQEELEISSESFSPVISNSHMTFKVGEGDDVDYSENVLDGPYESFTLKGRSLVNVITESSSKDVILPYEFEDGQYVTINDTKESGALGVELKGQTLVNVHGKKAYGLSQSGETMEANKFTNIVKGENYLSFDMVDGLSYGWGSFVDGGSLNLDMLKPNTKYLVYFTTAIFPEYFGVSFRNGDGTNAISIQAQINKGGNYVIITTTNEIVKSNQILYISIPQQHAGHYEFKDAMIIEYQQGMENWDIPYFEDMQSVKMPILKSVGKNLLPYNEMFVSPFTSATPYITKNVATFPFTLGVNGRGVGIKFKVEPNTTYTLSSNVVIPNTVVGVAFYKNESDTTNYNNKLGIAFSTNIEESTKTFTTPNECNWIVCGIYILYTYEQSGGTVVISEMPKLQLEKNTQATSYEAYKSSILSLPEEVVLRSLPNGVCDTFNTRTGVYTQRVYETTITGTGDWGQYDASNTNRQETIAFSVNLGLGDVFDNDKTYSRLGGVICDKLNHINSVWGSDKDIEGISADQRNVIVQIKKTRLASEDVAGFKTWLTSNNLKVGIQLKVPTITKINLSSTLKSWNTTTHIYSEIPENTLYPILSHSNPTYPVILKPSTKYSIVANSYSNNHTNSAINFNLGGTTTSTTVGNRVTTITTPSTLTSELLTMSGRGNKLNNVMVIEGDVVGDEPYFEGICDCKSPILSNIGETILETPFEKEFGTDAQKEFFRIVNCAEIFDNFGVGKQYTLSLDIKANKSGAARIYLQNGSGSRHNFSFDIPVTTEYVRHTKQITPTMAGDGHNFKESWLACFTTYNTGCFATIKNIRISTGEDEPYKSNILSCETYFDETTQSDKTIVLRSLPNGAYDTLNVETGEYTQRIGEVVLDGSEDEVWGYSEMKGDNLRFSLYSYIQALGERENTECLCDKWRADIQTNENSQEQISLYNHMIDNLVRTEVRITVSPAKLKTEDVIGLRELLSNNPITVQYELAKPITKTVDLSGYPFAYENGHVVTESNGLTPVIEYRLPVNRGGQLAVNAELTVSHETRLSKLEMLLLNQMVLSSYKATELAYAMKYEEVAHE